MILFLQSIAGQTRGGETTTLKLFEYFKARFPDVYPEQLRVLDSSINSPFKQMFNDYKLVKSLNPDMLVVDVSSGIRNLSAVAWAKANNRKIMVVMLGLRMSFRYSSFMVKLLVRFSERYILRAADIIYVNSHFTSSYVKKLLKKEPPILTIYPGLDDIIVKAGSENKTDGLISLLFVGECTEVKGLIYLVEALAGLKKLPVQLDIVGNYDTDSEYYKNLTRVIDENDIGDRVAFHGFVDREKLAGFYGRSDIFIQASLFEGYGKTLIEALCYGLCLITTRVGIVPELIEEGKNALVVESKSAAAITEAIIELAGNKGLMAVMRDANLAKAKTCPSWDVYEKNLDDSLKPIIDNFLKPEIDTQPANGE